jgi:hypothetical protein
MVAWLIISTSILSLIMGILIDGRGLSLASNRPRVVDKNMKHAKVLPLSFIPFKLIKTSKTKTKLRVRRPFFFPLFISAQHTSGDFCARAQKQRMTPPAKNPAAAAAKALGGIAATFGIAFGSLAAMTGRVGAFHHVILYSQNAGVGAGGARRGVLRA